MINAPPPLEGPAHAHVSHLIISLFIQMRPIALLKILTLLFIALKLTTFLLTTFTEKSSIKVKVRRSANKKENANKYFCAPKGQYDKSFWKSPKHELQCKPLNRDTN